MDSSTKDMRVTIHLSDVDCNESFPDRILSLSHPDFCVTVGRGSQSDENIEPAPDNAWFSSRVMSRQHALIRADPYDQILTIQDDASMHGTFLNGDRVGKARVDLIPGDILTFGTEVVRGEDTYQPLKVSIHYDWQDDQQEKETIVKATADISTSAPFRNKFTVDYSEGDFDSDFDSEESDIPITHKGAREQSVEFPSKTDTWIEATSLPGRLTTKEKLEEYEVNVTREQFKPPPFAEEDDSDAEQNASSPYYSDDEIESDIGSDSFDSECDIAPPDFSKEASHHDAGLTKVDSLLQSAQTSTSETVPAPCSTTVPMDNVEREPSPSDAALARPRLAIPPAPMPTPGVSVHTSTHPLDLHPFIQNTSFHEKYNRDLQCYPSFMNQGNQVPRPSHSFVNPYSYNCLNTPVYSMGVSGLYPSTTASHPWDTWKSVPLPCGTTQPSRTTARFAPPSCGPSTFTFPDPAAAVTIGQPSHSTSSSSSSDSSRGRKRKADEYELSEDEAEDLTPETTPSKTISSEHDTPSSPLISSKGPADLQASTDALEMSDMEGVSSLEVEERAYATTMIEQQPDGETQRKRHDKGNQHVEILTESDVQTEFDEGRLRKKCKIASQESTTTKSRLSTGLRYTATALVGATVGVLGTVIGLASLPTDYFV